MPSRQPRKNPWAMSPRAAEQAQVCIRAADMAARGASFSQIAAELDLPSPHDARQCVLQGYVLAPGEDYRMGRRKAARQLDMMTRAFWDLHDHPGYAATVTGKLIEVTDPDTGETSYLEDKHVKVAALNGLRAVNAEYRKLYGTDAPRQTVAISAASSLEEIHAHIARVRAEIQAAGDDPGYGDDDEDGDDGPPALPPGTR